MKFLKVIGISFLPLMLGVAALLCSQNKLFAQEQRDEAKPQPQEEARPEPNRPAQDEPKAARPGDARPAEQNEDKPVRNDKPIKQDDKSAHQDDKSSQQMDRNGQTDRNAPSEKDQHSAGNRIPDDKFRSHFGRQHTFKVRVANGGGRPNFQYGGYTFTLVDAWPADWAYSDDCYVDYVDGEYFLFDLAHPGIRIAVIVL